MWNKFESASFEPFRSEFKLMYISYYLVIGMIIWWWKGILLISWLSTVGNKVKEFLDVHIINLLVKS